jgi:hypothetical protein
MGIACKDLRILGTAHEIELVIYSLVSLFQKLLEAIQRAVRIGGIVSLKAYIFLIGMINLSILEYIGKLVTV